MTDNLLNQLDTAMDDAVQGQIEQVTNELAQQIPVDLGNLPEQLNELSVEDLAVPVAQHMGVENAQGILDTAVQGIQKLLGRFFN